MKKIACMLAVLLLCIPMMLSYAEDAQTHDEFSGLCGHYVFEKQIYMIPLSSFIAPDGYEEYYTFSKDSFIITDRHGGRRVMAVSYQQTPLKEEAFQESFLMEWPSIPDISSYKEKRQYTLTSAMDNAAYRLYLLDDEVWLARIQQNSANTQKEEYIWSIFKIMRLDGGIPLRVSIFGTKDGVEDFLALNRDFQSGYDEDACYNITPDGILENSGYSVFKYDKSCASFLMYEGEVYPLGEWFGGYGVASMALADLNKDGMQELYFTYSFGSGLHRSHVACFDPAINQVVPVDYMHINKDMIVSVSETGGLSLYEAAFPSMDSFVEYTMEGAGHLADIVYEDGRLGVRPVKQKQ